jgi:hypothetical protein
MLQRFPEIQLLRSDTDEDCLTFVKEEHCVLFADDELQLRHIIIPRWKLQGTRLRNPGFGVRVPLLLHGMLTGFLHFLVFQIRCLVIGNASNDAGNTQL